MQALALGANRETRLPERPRIENELIEDEVMAFSARTQAELYPAISGGWHIGYKNFLFHAPADFDRDPVKRRDQKPVALDGFRRCPRAGLRLHTQGCHDPRLKAMLLVEKCAHRPGILRTCFVEIEIARARRRGRGAPLLARSRCAASAAP